MSDSAEGYCPCAFACHTASNPCSLSCAFHHEDRWLEDAARLAAHVAELERWKQEAIVVLGEWDEVHIALGKPGRLGESKALASAARVAELRDQC